MVKGNWERRIEKADKRKAAKKDAKAAKAKGQLVDPLDILNAVFLKNADAHVWISAPNGAKLCAAHFRQGDCPNRRCKWSHAESLAPWGPAPTDAKVQPERRTTRDMPKRYGRPLGSVLSGSPLLLMLL